MAETRLTQNTIEQAATYDTPILGTPLVPSREIETTPNPKIFNQRRMKVVVAGLVVTKAVFELMLLTYSGNSVSMYIYIYIYMYVYICAIVIVIVIITIIIIIIIIVVHQSTSTDHRSTENTASLAFVQTSEGARRRCRSWAIAACWLGSAPHKEARFS